VKTEGLSRQQKRAQVREAAKTIGKLNHLIKNPAQTAGKAKADNKNIQACVARLTEMGVIKPPPWHKRAFLALKQVPRFFKRLWVTFKHHSNLGDVF
jgi:hypothetical protein